MQTLAIIVWYIFLHAHSLAHKSIYFFWIIQIGCNAFAIQKARRQFLAWQISYESADSSQNVYEISVSHKYKWLASAILYWPDFSCFPSLTNRFHFSLSFIHFYPLLKYVRTHAWAVGSLSHCLFFLARPFFVLFTDLKSARIKCNYSLLVHIHYLCRFSLLACIFAYYEILNWTYKICIV